MVQHLGVVGRRIQLWQDGLLFALVDAVPDADLARLGRAPAGRAVVHLGAVTDDDK